jgi:hypothetical protein
MSRHLDKQIAEFSKPEQPSEQEKHKMSTRIMQDGTKEIYTEDGQGWTDWRPVVAVKDGDTYWFGLGTPAKAFRVSNAQQQLVRDETGAGGFLGLKDWITTMTLFYRFEDGVLMVNDSPDRDTDWYVEADEVTWESILGKPDDKIPADAYDRSKEQRMNGRDPFEQWVKGGERLLSVALGKLPELAAKYDRYDEEQRMNEEYEDLMGEQRLKDEFEEWVNSLNNSNVAF